MKNMSSCSVLVVPSISLTEPRVASSIEISAPGFQFDPTRNVPAKKPRARRSQPQSQTSSNSDQHLESDELADHDLADQDIQQPLVYPLPHPLLPHPLNQHRVSNKKNLKSNKISPSTSSSSSLSTITPSIPPPASRKSTRTAQKNSLFTNYTQSSEITNENDNDDDFECDIDM
jgi:hypothetical protein